MSLTVTQERPDTPDAATLIAELDDILNPLYAAGSRHGFSVQKLIDQGVNFYVLRSDGVPAGCGGILLVGQEYGELKRMYVRPQFRGRGLGKQIVERLSQHAREHGVMLLRLETGIHQTEAIGLYEQMGFYRIAPFGPYFEDPVSLCYEKPLT
jgi:GNAT superfamily N-acetyltransferase